jgi:phenylalanyl-tRNA synthetase alpha chain
MDLQELEKVYEKAQGELEAITDVDALNAWERDYLGSKGQITLAVRGIPDLAPEERPVFGRRVNEIKQALSAKMEAREEAIDQAEMQAQLESGGIDVTLPGRPRSPGRLHPAIRGLRQYYEIWAEMGFQVYTAPDVETDDNNFSLLNIPPHHPARDMWDTFYTTTEGVLLRTHTSPGQIRAMREYYPEPVRVILPGMCYRYEQITARSEIQFHQVEGLAIGRNIRMSDLKGTITAFAKRFYGEGRDLKLRFRGSYFPFTEPSLEVDVECTLCGGMGCRVCKHTGWLEIAGCGMVHPVVLQNGGYDPQKYSGFAFGLGPERSTMLKYGIEDIRYFWGNDLRFLEQF